MAITVHKRWAFTDKIVKNKLLEPFCFWWFRYLIHNLNIHKVWAFISRTGHFNCKWAFFNLSFNAFF